VLIPEFKSFMRKPYLILVLPLLLLLTQQLAAVHEIGHYTTDIAKSQQKDKNLPDGKQCEQCFAFASIAGAATSKAPSLALAVLAYHYSSSVQSALVAADTPAHRNRGPPVLL
jgi:hypothetical protein